MKNKKLMIAIALIVMLLGIEGIQNVWSTSDKMPNKKPVIGILQYVSHPSLNEIYTGFEEEMIKKGYIPGESVVFDFKNGQADQSKLTTMSEQLIRKKPDVLVGIATPAAQSLANQTQEIPIVLGAITDPKAAGLVESNERPGQNITGVSDQSPLDAQLDLMLSLMPSLETVGILYASSEDNSAAQVKDFEDLAQKKGLKVKPYAVPSTNEIAQTTQVMIREVDAIYIPTDNTVANAFQTVVSIADSAKIPVFPSVSSMVAEGGLATVGINQYQLGVETAHMVIDILNGKQPATTPIYTFKTGELVVNEEKAKKLGINIPTSLKKDLK